MLSARDLDEEMVEGNTRFEGSRGIICGGLPIEWVYSMMAEKSNEKGLSIMSVRTASNQQFLEHSIAR